MQDLDAAVTRVQAGQSDAFRHIVAATQARLVRMAARMVGNLAEAEDVVQEAYVKAYRAIVAGQFDQRAKVETWLYRIVVHAAIDSSRQRRGRARRDDEAATDLRYEPFEQLEARHALGEIAELLSGLPEEQRTALVLRTLEGLSSKEVAHILECSEGAVEQRLVRARQTLREKRGSRE